MSDAAFQLCAPAPQLAHGGWSKHHVARCRGRTADHVERRAMATGPYHRVSAARGNAQGDAMQPALQEELISSRAPLLVDRPVRPRMQGRVEPMGQKLLITRLELYAVNALMTKRPR